MKFELKTRLTDVIVNRFQTWGLPLEKIYLTIVCLITTLGTSVPVGFNISIVGALGDHVQKWSNETLIQQYDICLNNRDLNILWSTIVSIFLIGGAISSLGGAWIADRFGRKGSLLACATLFLISGALFITCRIAKSVEMVLLARLISGFGSGLATSVAPMYISEIAPLHLRGPLATLFSLSLCFGILFGGIVSLEETLGTPELWHYSFCVYAIGVIIFVLFSTFFPESPKYLYIIAGKKEKALDELKRLRGKDQIEAINEELKLMENEAKQNSEKRTLWSVIIDSELRVPLTLCCVIQAGQQLSGITAVAYYCVPLYEVAGLNTNQAKWANFGAGLVTLATAAFTPIIVAKINRRPVLLLSCILCGSCLIFLTLIVHFLSLASWLPWTSIIVVLGFTCFYQFGLGAVPYFIGAELFESSPRPAAMALGSITSWTCNFASALFFPTMQLAMGAFVFVPYTLICFSLALFIQLYLPETRNRDPSQIAPLLRNGFKSKRIIE